MTVTVPRKSDKQEFSTSVDLGENLSKAVELFGGEAVFRVYQRAAEAALKLKAYGFVNRKEHAETAPQELRSALDKYVATWVPGQGRVRKTIDEKVRDLLEGLPPEQVQAVLDRLQQT